MTTPAALDPRIGILCSGRFYCFPNGYAAPEFEGTLQEVEVALGLRPAGLVAPRFACVGPPGRSRLIRDLPAK